MLASHSAHADNFTRDNLPPRETWPELRFDLPELKYPEWLNCADALLDRWVSRGRGEARCIVSEAEPWSYTDLLGRANQVANVLVKELGVVPGNRVLIRGPNNPWNAATWFGVMKAGAVAVCTMPLLRAGELAKIASLAEGDIAICDHRFTADLETAGIRGLRMLRYGGVAGDDLIQLASRQPSTFQNVRTAADDVCMLAFTSGTTGNPKATMHFHRDVLAIADTFSRNVLRPGPDDLFAGSPPLAFTFGLGGLLIFPLHAGAATLLLEQAPPTLLLEAIAKHRVTTLFTAPTAYRAMVPLLRAGEFKVPTLRRCVSAGETLPAATWHSFHDATGLKVIDGIGSTEMLHIFISAADDDIRPGHTGLAIPGYIAEVQDAEGRPVPDGMPGRLAVKGPTGCRYLFGDRQGSYVQNGWNITGDVYVRDSDGYFAYQARSDDMIISSGYNIAGPEVEDALLRHAGVAEAAVVGAPDPERGTIVKAYVVPTAEISRDEAGVRALQDFVKLQIAPYKYPRVIEFVDELPKTATGKLQRFRLRPER